MSGYGYTFRSFSTYNTVRGESRGTVIKPFAPFVPNTNSNPSEGHLTQKKIVPVASRPDGDDDDYPARDDDYGSPRKVDEFLTKVPNEASRPPRFSPVTSTDWRQSPQPTTYGDYGSNKEGSKPIGGTIMNDNYDGYNGTNGYGNYGSKERSKPLGGTIKNDNYDGTDGYNDYGNYGSKEGRKPANGYGDYGNKERYKPASSPIRNDKYDGHNGPNGFGDYGNKEEYKPATSPSRNDKYDGYNVPNGYGNYGNKDGYKAATSPIRNDKYDVYYGPNGYDDHGNYNNKEGQRPFGSTTRNDNYGGYNNGNGYGDYGNYSNKEGYKPSGSPVLKDNYDRHRPAENYNATEPIKTIPGGWSKPKISPGWTASPRKGTQLSTPTNDIDKAMELLKEAVKLTSDDNSNKGGHKGSGSSLAYDNYDDYQRRHDKPTSKFSKGMELVKEAERLKNNATGTSQSNKDYGDATRRDGNFNFLSRPRTSPTPVTFVDGREADYRDTGGRDDTRLYANASIIDSEEAEKKYKGRRV